jgi:hypothetical protein
MATVLQSLYSAYKKLFPGGVGTPAVPDPGQPIGTAYIAPILYTLDEQQNMLDGQLLIGASAVGAIANPSAALTLTPTTGGSLTPGTYQVAITYKNVYGQTQVGTSTASITLGSGETAIHIAALTLPAGATGVNRYVSDAAGSITLRLQSTASNGNTYDVTSLPGDTADTPPGSNTTASNNHAEKGTPGAGTGLSVTLGPGSFVYAYDPSGPVDQNGQPMLNFVLESMADVDFPDPTANTGRIIYGTTTQTPYYCDGSTWAPFAAGGTLSDASSSTKGIVKLTQDFGGTADSPKVTGLQGRAVDSAAPTNGQVLGWDSTASKWKPVAGASSNATSIRGHNVSTTAPTAGQALVSNGTSYVPTDIVSSAGNATYLQGRPIASTAPSSGQALVWDGSNYVPGDVVSSAGNANSIGGFTVATDTPADGDVLTWVDADSAWKPQAPSGGGGSGLAVQMVNLDPGSITAVSAFNTIPIPLDTVDFDPAGFWSSGDPTKLTVPAGQGGVYFAQAKLQLTTDPTTPQTWLHFSINGTGIDASITLDSNGNDNSHSKISYLLTLAAGDYVELMCRNQNSGGSPQGFTDRVIFSMHKVA